MARPLGELAERRDGRASRRRAMELFVAVIAIVLIAFLTFAIRWRRRRTSVEARSGPAIRDTLPMDAGQRTIRSYFVPKGWSRPAVQTPRLEPTEAERRRYGNASVAVMQGAEPAKWWPLLRGRTRLGRDSDNHVVLDDERVSLHHALITVRDDVYWIEDLGSTNGTFVGEDERVMTPHPLEDGEQIRLGGLKLLFRGERQ